MVKLFYHGVCSRCHGRQARVGRRLLLARVVPDVESLVPGSVGLGKGVPECVRGLLQSAAVALHQVFI